MRVHHLPHLPGPSVALLGEGNMANTLVVRVDLEVPTVGDVVEVLDILNAKGLRGVRIAASERGVCISWRHSSTAMRVGKNKRIYF